MRAPAALVALFLAGCTSALDVAEDAAATADQPLPLTRAADRLAPVSDANRDLRACLLGVAFLEVGVAKVAEIDPARRTAVLGRVVDLSARVRQLRAAEGSHWPETEMAYVGLAIVRLLAETARERALASLSLGLSFEAALDAGRQLGVTTIVGGAVVRDVRRILAGVDAGRIDRAEGWAACEGRLEDQAGRLSL